MGKGEWSDNFEFIPRYFPSKPPNPPRDVRLKLFKPESGTDRTSIEIEYDRVKEDGGWPILNYNIYIDNCDNGTTNTSYTNGVNLIWNTKSESLALTKDCYYRLWYSATNEHGEGPISNTVVILVAEVPDKPKNLIRIDMESITAGDIRIHWEKPDDEGEDPVLGYKLYLDNTLHLDASNSSTLNTYTYTGLSVGEQYNISVTAVNDIGESAPSSLDLLAASVP